MQRLNNPLPLFIDSRGALLDAGYIYVGDPDADPETNPIALFLDQDLTIPIEQPLRTLGGLILDGENAVFVYMAESDYSITIKDANSVLVAYVPSVATAAPSYQPLDADLTAIAALATTAYGRALLTLANQAALQAAVGLPAALPLTGGTITGNITRSGAGGHVYFADAALTTPKITVSAASGGNPTSAPGEIWIGV
jgi:hypothetical protein